MFDFLKTLISTPPQETVVLLGICPKCHKKTLVQKYKYEELNILQCSPCNLICIRD